MKSPRYLLFLLAVAGVVVGQACSKALVIENVNYAQPIESVLVPDENGVVTDIRHGLSFSVSSLQAEEFGEDSTQQVNEVRMIRNSNGYYFITANNFRHVYVMKPGDGELKLKKQILISEDGIKNPAFNWRSPMVELVSVGTNEHHFITEKGIITELEEQS